VRCLFVDADGVGGRIGWRNWRKAGSDWDWLMTVDAVYRREDFLDFEAQLAWECTGKAGCGV
jgi:hypothetical protein